MYFVRCKKVFVFIFIFNCQVKAAFTRAYNKTSAPTPYAAVPIKKGSKAEVDFIDSIPDEGEEGVSQIPEDDEEDVEEVDTMIVVGFYYQMFLLT